MSDDVGSEISKCIAERETQTRMKAAAVNEIACGAGGAAASYIMPKVVATEAHALGCALAKAGIKPFVNDWVSQQEANAMDHCIHSALAKRFPSEGMSSERNQR